MSRTTRFPNRTFRTALRRSAIGIALTASFGLGSLVAPASSHYWIGYASSPPTITGTAQQGQTLTEVHASWTERATGYSYQWLRCDSWGASCATIVSATSQTYVPVEADVGHKLRVQETETTFWGFSHREQSAATAAVVPPTPTSTSNAGGSATPAESVTGPSAAHVFLSSRPVIVTRRGTAPIQVSCPADAGEGCRGTITIRLSEPPARGARALISRCARGCRPLGSAKYEARAGKKVRVRVKIASVGRRLLARRKALRVTVVATSVSGGNTTTTTLTTTLKASARVA